MSRFHDRLAELMAEEHVKISEAYVAREKWWAAGKRFQKAVLECVGQTIGVTPSKVMELRVPSGSPDLPDYLFDVRVDLPSYPEQPCRVTVLRTDSITWQNRAILDFEFRWFRDGDLYPGDESMFCEQLARAVIDG